MATEKALGNKWKELLEEKMMEAAEEKRLAIEKGSFHEGVPAIYISHSYNAKSGVGIIIGAKTRKILYIGV